MSETPSFYGREPRWFTADRIYKVYIGDDSLRAARMAGGMSDDQAINIMATASFGLLGLLLAKPLIKRQKRRRKEREAFYDALEPDSPDFLPADKRNFVIHRSEVLRVNVIRKRSRWTGPEVNSGMVRIETFGGTRKLILMGHQDPASIEAQLARVFGSVAVPCPATAA